MAKKNRRAIMLLKKSHAGVSEKSEICSCFLNAFLIERFDLLERP
jgi:hypothetical protein